MTFFLNLSTRRTTCDHPWNHCPMKNCGWTNIPAMPTTKASQIGRPSSAYLMRRRDMLYPSDSPWKWSASTIPRGSTMRLQNSVLLCLECYSILRTRCCGVGGRSWQSRSWVRVNVNQNWGNFVRRHKNRMGKVVTKTKDRKPRLNSLGAVCRPRGNHVAHDRTECNLTTTQIVIGL